MKMTTVLASAMLLFGLTGVAHATNMFAGPLSSDLGCVCEIVNVSTSDKTIEIKAFNKGGTQTNSSGSILLLKGAANDIPTLATSLQYCEFVNASPGSFRASISCSDSSGASFALPAR